GVSAQLIEKAQALESLLIQQGVVAIAKTSLTAEQLVLLRETGVVIITTSVDGIDTEVTAETIEEAVEKIVELVRL
ncbi:TPA: sulfate adenylyltransferase subunit CysN, partial [Acinetobacter baumannii]